jgi:hypothetical protein
MVGLQVDQTVALCATLGDVGCSIGDPRYYIFDTDIDQYRSQIPTCLNLSGIQIEFQWSSDVADSVDSHNCSGLTLIKPLGTAITNSSGIAVLQYKITQNDLDLYNVSMGAFDLRACIRSPVPLINTGEVRGAFHFDSIIISPQLAPTKLYFYFEIPDIYSAEFVTSKLSMILQTAMNILLPHTGYYPSIDFDPNTHILTVTVTGPAPSPMNVASEYRLQKLDELTDRIIMSILPFGILIVLFQWMFGRFLGAKSVSGEVPSTRIITINPKICKRDTATGQVTDCNPPTAVNPVTVEYIIDKKSVVVDVIDTSPVIFSAPTNVDIVVTARVKGNAYYNIYNETIPKGTTNETRDAIFVSQADATVNVTGLDSDTSLPICGFYIVSEQASDGSFQIRAKGVLDSNGKAPIFKPPADKTFCVTIVPCNQATYSSQLQCMKLVAGQEQDINILLDKCAKAKNGVSVRTVYVAQDGSRNDFTADTIEVFVSGNLTPVLTATPTTNITAMSGFDKNIDYVVRVTKAGYTITSNDQHVQFTTDCFDVKALTISAQPPAGSYDVTLRITDCNTTSPLQGAIVTIDSGIPKKADITGSVFMAAIPDGSHKITISLTSYNDISETITISSASTIPKCLTPSQVFATKDTRINKFTYKGEMAAGKAVKFSGDLEYLDGTVWNALTDASVAVTITDNNNQVVAVITASTHAGVFDVGYFETTEWSIPDSLASKAIEVCASFEGVGQYKASSSCSNYTIGVNTSADCWIPNPLGGCILSANSGKTIAIVAGLTVAGILVISLIKK